MSDQRAKIVSKSTKSEIVSKVEAMPKPTKTDPSVSTKLMKKDPEPNPDTHQKLMDYRCVCLPDLKGVYLKLLNDNIIHLIESIYTNREKPPYHLAETRIALAMQMIVSSDQLIPTNVAMMIAKDMDDLRKNDEYINRWVNPAKKRKQMIRELEVLRKHTEIDDSISLNLADQTDTMEKINVDEMDIRSGISTLNVSASCPIPEEEGRGNCQIM